MRFAINSDSAMAQTWSGGSSGYAWHVPAFTPGVQPKVAVVPTMEDAFFVNFHHYRLNHQSLIIESLID